MNNTMTYKGYTGSVEFSREDGILWGRVLGLQQHIIDYEGESISELEKDFHAGIDHYLKICKEEGIKPNKPCSGKLLLRMPPEVHAGLEYVTEKTGLSANQLIVDAVRIQYFNESPEQKTPKQRGKKQKTRLETTGAR